MTDEEYNPFEHRNLKHPLSNKQAFFHIIKSCLGAGILGMPSAFSYGGLIFSVVGMIILAIICIHGQKILIRVAHIIYRRKKVPSMSYAEIGEASVLLKFPSSTKGALAFKYLINFFIFLNQYLICCVYVVFVCENAKQLVEHYFSWKQPIQIYMLILWPFLLLVNLIRDLEKLSYVSIISNILITFGTLCTLYYIFKNSVDTSELHYIGHITNLHIFFGIAFFSLEGIGTLMHIENTMKDASRLVGCPLSVQSIAIVLLTAFYTLVGFFGYYHYGNNVKSSITLNILINDVVAQILRIVLSVGMYLSYPLQYYVINDIVWSWINRMKPGVNKKWEYGLRLAFISSTVIVTSIIPKLAAFFSLSGAVCLSALGIIFPPIIETMTLWDEPGMGLAHWRLIKNVIFLIFGILALIFGLLASIRDIIKTFNDPITPEIKYF